MKQLLVTIALFTFLVQNAFANGIEYQKKGPKEHLFSTTSNELAILGNLDNDKIIETTRTYNFSKLSVENLTELTIPIPQDIEGVQQILSIEFSPKPNMIKRTGELVLAKWDYDFNKPTQIEIKTVLMLIDNDLKTIRHHGKLNNDSKGVLSRYLKSEAFIHTKNKEFRRIASSLRGVNQLATVKNIFNYVKESLVYSDTRSENLGTKTAKRLGEGDCTEYSELMVSMCRILGIPSRVLFGYTLSRARNPLHNWPEVYLDSLGWVSFDPTFSDTAPERTTFNNLKNQYVRYGVGGHLFGMNYRYTGNIEPNLNWPRYHFEDMSNSIADNMVDLLLTSEIRLEDPIKNIIQENPLTYKSYCLEALIKLKNQDTKAATSMAQIAIRKAKTDKEKARVLYLFAKIKTLMGDLDLAENYLEGALANIELDKKSIQNDKSLKLLLKEKSVKRLLRKYKVGTSK